MESREITPLLQVKNGPVLKVSPEAVMPALHQMKRQLTKDPDHAPVYKQEIQKSIEAGCVKKLQSNKIELGDNFLITKTYSSPISCLILSNIAYHFLMF